MLWQYTIDTYCQWGHTASKDVLQTGFRTVNTSISNMCSVLKCINKVYNNLATRYKVTNKHRTQSHTSCCASRWICVSPIRTTSGSFSRASAIKRLCCNATIIWNAHSVLLPILCCRLPLYDEHTKVCSNSHKNVSAVIINWWISW